MRNSRQYDGLEIAIIGMSGKFPGSADCRQYWRNLKDGIELIKTFSEDELRSAGVSEATLHDDRYVRAFGAIDDKDRFDAGFWGYTVEEATLMDPQIRLLHEQCWMALEDAGYAPMTEKVKIGLFSAASTNDNWKIYGYSKMDRSQLDPFYLNILMSHNFISSLISYKLNLRGPSIFIDTACSSSLTAVHLACRSLLTRECTIALAGGVSLKTITAKGYFYEEGMISSQDGHCRSFDARASGTVSGEGAGIVVLKRLNEAIKDRDNIYCIIRSTSANNDGSSKVGYTAPGVKGQVECISAAHKLAGIDPRHISYIEAHGTATKLGDPVEIRALNEAFSVGGGEKFCAVGSVKSNLGHLDAAAGVAGLIKTALCLKNKQIPASLHFREPNPDIDFENGPFYINAELKEWQDKENRPLYAGVNSLGIGGTNVHAILEEAPIAGEDDPGREFQLLSISARTPHSLLRYKSSLRKFLSDEPQINLADLSYSLHIGRKHFGCRHAWVYRDRQDLLKALDVSDLSPLQGQEKKVSPVFLFPGQGAQYIHMGRDLYDGASVFKEEMDKGFSILSTLTGKSFKEILFPSEKDHVEINETRYTQPLLFLLEYSLARLMMSLGVIPRYMIGHSIGEYVAACISGVFSFEDALRLVVKRGQLMNELPPGDMISLPITAERAFEYTGGGISLAAVNGPHQVVLSGDPLSIEDLTKKLALADIPWVKLRTSHAFHSAMQDPIVEVFRKELENIVLHPLQIPFVSNLTGTLISTEDAMSPQYWARHLRDTVRFSRGIQYLLSKKEDLLFIEAGPGHSLTSLLKQQATKEAHPSSLSLIRSFKEKENDLSFLTRQIGRIWQQGVEIDWAAYYKEEKRRRISLPAYSFEPTRFPAEVDPFMNEASHPAGTGSRNQWRQSLYYPFWKSTMPHQSTDRTSRRDLLLFIPDEKWADVIRKALAAGSQRIISILPGNEYRKISPEMYLLDASRPGELEKLFEELRSLKIDAADLVYAWGMSVQSLHAEETSPSGWDRVFFSVVDIMKGLAKNSWLEDKRMFILTNSVYGITGAEKLSDAQSLLVSLGKVIPQEYAIPCQHIDLDLGNAPAEGALLLAREIATAAENPDRKVAFRNGQRWIPDYQQIIQSAEGTRPPFRKGGVYMVTGGLGNVGYTLSRYLIQHYDATIILTGRRVLKISGDPGGEAHDQVQIRLDHLKMLSKEVKYFSGDIADADALRKIVEEAELATGAIEGIIHAAGVVDTRGFELIEDISREKAFAQFAPKIKGIENIYELFKDRKLAFVCITSSISSVLGGLGFTAYAAANVFMEHFVTSKQKELVNWKCIALAEMSFADAPSGHTDSALTPTEIAGLFEWALSLTGVPVVVQTKEDLFARIHKAHMAGKGIFAEEEEVYSEPLKTARPDLKTAYAEPVTGTEQKLKELFEKFFAVTSIGADDDFFDLGGDSLKGMVLLKRIKKEFNTHLMLKDFLEKATIRGISAKIDEVLWIGKDIKMENEITI